MLKKYRYLLIIISVITIGIVFYRSCCSKKALPINYDEQHSKELSEVDENRTSWYNEQLDKELRAVDENHPYWKEHGFVLKKVDELEDSLAEVYDVTGENGIGWHSDPGDFSRIRLKLNNQHTVQFDNDTGWAKVIEESDWIPTSPKIQKHPYGITLEMGEGQILILMGAGPNELLTLIFIEQDTAKVILYGPVKVHIGRE